LSDTSTPFGPNESAELLALAQEAGHVGVFEWQVPTGSLRPSPRFLSLYGLHDFDGRYGSWIKSVHREDQVRVRDLIDTAFASQAHEVQAEFRLAAEPGAALRWMELRAVVSYAEDGQPLRVVGVSVDVTERKRAMAELRAFADILEDAV
jgi:PAS domain S-box-containing protein